MGVGQTPKPSRQQQSSTHLSLETRGAGAESAIKARSIKVGIRAVSKQVGKVDPPDMMHILDVFIHVFIPHGCVLFRFFQLLWHPSHLGGAREEAEVAVKDVAGLDAVLEEEGMSHDVVHHVVLEDRLRGCACQAPGEGGKSGDTIDMAQGRMGQNKPCRPLPCQLHASLTAPRRPISSTPQFQYPLHGCHAPPHTRTWCVPCTVTALWYEWWIAQPLMYCLYCSCPCMCQWIA